MTANQSITPKIRQTNWLLHVILIVILSSFSGFVPGTHINPQRPVRTEVLVLADRNHARTVSFGRNLQPSKLHESYGGSWRGMVCMSLLHYETFIKIRFDCSEKRLIPIKRTFRMLKPKYSPRDFGEVIADSFGG